MSDLENIAASHMGALGGRSGTGKCKTRSPEHYQRLAEARGTNRLLRLGMSPEAIRARIGEGWSYKAIAKLITSK